MANEAELIFETELPIPMKCGDTVGIEQGTVLKLSDEFYAVAAAGDRDLIAGIAAAEKIANDGTITIPVYRRGIFKMTASGNITLGDPLVAHNNLVVSAINENETTLSGNRILGTALGTATDTQTVMIELNPTVTQGK